MKLNETIVKFEYDNAEHVLFKILDMVSLDSVVESLTKYYKEKSKTVFEDTWLDGYILKLEKCNFHKKDDDICFMDEDCYDLVQGDDHLILF